MKKLFSGIKEQEEKNKKFDQTFRREFSEYIFVNGLEVHSDIS